MDQPTTVKIGSTWYIGYYRPDKKMIINATEYDEIGLINWFKEMNLGQTKSVFIGDESYIVDPLSPEDQAEFKKLELLMEESKRLAMPALINRTFDELIEGK